MLMPSVDINWTAHSVLKSDAHLMRLAFPLVELAAWLAAGSRDRVRSSGRGPAGMFWRYSKRTKERRLVQGKPNTGRRFEETGQMWEGLRVRLGSPTKARASFVGRRGGKSRGSFRTNAKLARFLMQWEKLDLLAPTAPEQRHMGKLAQSLFSRELHNALNLEHIGFKASQRVRSLERKAKKAKRDLARVRGVG